MPFDDILKSEAAKLGSGLLNEQPKPAQDIKNPFTKEQMANVELIEQNRPNVDFTQKYDKPFLIESKSQHIVEIGGLSTGDSYPSTRKETVGLEKHAQNPNNYDPASKEYYGKVIEDEASKEKFSVKLNPKFEGTNPEEFSFVYKNTQNEVVYKAPLIKDAKGEYTFEVDYSKVKQGDFNRGSIEIINNNTGEVAVHQNLNVEDTYRGKNIDPTKPVAIMFVDTNATNIRGYDTQAQDMVAFAQAKYGKDNVIVLTDMSDREAAMFVDAFNKDHGKENLHVDFYSHGHHGKKDGFNNRVHQERDGTATMDDRQMVGFINNIHSQEPKFYYSNGCKMDPKPYVDNGINVGFPATYMAENISYNINGLKDKPENAQDAQNKLRQYDGVGGTGFIQTVEIITNQSLTSEQKQTQLQQAYDDNRNINYGIGKEPGKVYAHALSAAESSEQQITPVTPPAISITAHKETLNANDLPGKSNASYGERPSLTTEVKSRQ